MEASTQVIIKSDLSLKRQKVSCHESMPDIDLTIWMQVGKNPFKCENDLSAKNYDKTVDTCVKACL